MRQTSRRLTADLLVLLPQLAGQRGDAAAVLRDRRCELLPIGHQLANALDADVGDPVLAAMVRDAPHDVDGLLPVGLDNLAGDQGRAIAHRLVPRNHEALPGVLIEVSPVDVDHVVVEYLLELLPLAVACRSPIAAEDKARDAVDIERLIHQLRKFLLALRDWRLLVADQLDHRVPEIGHAAAGVPGGG